MKNSTLQSGRIGKHVIMVALGVLPCLSGSSVMALEIVDKIVSYSIRETPTDPSSAVIYRIDLELMEWYLAPEYVDYKVLKATITEFDSIGNEIASWSISNPVVDTSNGLWHVASANPSDSDYLEPPPISGVADAMTQGDDDLDFSLVGNTPAQGPFTLTASLDYSLRLVADPLPTAENEDEPSEGTVTANP